MTTLSSPQPQNFFARWRAEHASQITDFRRGLYRFSRNRLSVIGLSIVILLLIVAVTAPLWVPYPQDVTGSVNMAERLKAPSAEHWFGTDDAGRDVFSRTIMATRISFQVGVIILVVAISIGVVLGAIAGYYGGWVNTVIMRFTDIMLTFPGIFLALAVSAALGRGVLNATLALSITWWPGYCRLVEAQMLKMREEDFVAGARAIGASNSRIIFRHILPNLLTAIIVKASMDFGFAVLSLASLGFIGVGVLPPEPDWGSMISAGRRFIPASWWYSTFPGLFMFVTVLAFNLLGDGLRDLLDPNATVR
ncbi:MAG: ABC transporter permease [Chloroflexi bacterium]|nr:ABC transporter permease [Chloroflexota bacterium]MCC6893248.1 ABC transporter permease [Anaerolineae bacterium]